MQPRSLTPQRMHPNHHPDAQDPLAHVQQVDETDDLAAGDIEMNMNAISANGSETVAVATVVKETPSPAPEPIVPSATAPAHEQLANTSTSVAEPKN